jgi:hypothetical protein
MIFRMPPWGKPLGGIICAGRNATSAARRREETTMNEKRDSERRRHESIDHLHPTDAGLMDPDPAHQPATGIMGDETLVRLIGGGIPAYPGIEGNEDRRGRSAQPGPTRWDDPERPVDHA